ncbi:Deoxyribodipyrimidine photo-lyase/cryptochrome family protein [Limnobacter sp. 130]|uniref:FAD-binding domain-containing protein n=1 Tax=Limnobacter sp. 130 TaxID=2653147 RepID=UPI0012EF4696|nr:FAD-binding domain-containing protein [Limnobacter sp. 130]VWX32515.1 Deoxyribodipyrimidine photo-lyase/cryptochrome family protein [Limnobacter sp. 130]
MQVLWFKRDLRLSDHLPLFEAMRNAKHHGLVLPLYIHEPSQIADAHTARQHQLFVHECLDDLQQQLSDVGGYLHEELGEAVDVLAALHAQFKFTHLWAHQETTQLAQYQRDKAVVAWCKSVGVVFTELPQNNVQRATFMANPFAEKVNFQTYLDRAAQEEIKNPAGRNLKVFFAPQPPVELNRATVPHAAGEDKPLRMKGGRVQARAVAAQFFTPAKLKSYPFSISSPLKAWNGCSRLSPYLAYGVVSDREVLQKLNALVNTVHGQGDAALTSKVEDAARFYVDRLIWRQGYLQQFENHTGLETDAFYSNEPAEINHDYLNAWRQGHTGFAYVDACQRFLNQTGWLNMRARATLVSFACVQLGLPWQPVALFLAQQFLDFEPAIHYGQVRIASGTSHFSQMLVYDPLKQQAEQDPKGEFVKRWLPEYGTAAYPKPIVDNTESLKLGKARLHAMRQNPRL